jgi:hypothetical protein
VTDQTSITINGITFDPLPRQDDGRRPFFVPELAMCICLDRHFDRGQTIDLRTIAARSGSAGT